MSRLIIAFFKVLSETQLVRILPIIVGLFLQTIVALSMRGINPSPKTLW